MDFHIAFIRSRKLKGKTPFGFHAGYIKKTDKGRNFPFFYGKTPRPLSVGEILRKIPEETSLIP
jgi:hypothetical protein